jgi:hypothetical protein
MPLTNKPVALYARPITFTRLLMRFSWKGREISLKGVEAPKHRLVEDVDACRELKRRKVGWICQLFPLTGWDSV